MGFPINPPRVPLVDLQSGTATTEFYKFLLAIQKVIGGPSDPFVDTGLLNNSPTLALPATLASLADLDATPGLLAQTGTDTFAKRTLTEPAAGFTITNPAGTAGNPTFALAHDLAALEGLGSTGIAVRTAANTWAQRTITAGTGISVADGDGVAGNPTISCTVTAYTDEMAQDAVGAMVDATLNYVDATPLLQRAALTGEVTASAGSNATTVADGVLDVANFVASAIVTEAEGLASSDNDTSIPTTAAVKDYVDDEIAGVGGGSGTDLFATAQVYRTFMARADSTSIALTSDNGLLMTNTGTLASLAISATSYATTRPRLSVSTGASAGAFAALREATLILFRQNALKMSWRWRYETQNASDRRFFAGLTSDTLLNTVEDPDQFDHVLGVGVNDDDTNFFFIHNDSGTGTATRVDTTIALTVGNFYELQIEWAAGGDPTLTLYYWNSTSPTATGSATTTPTTDIPSTTQQLTPYIWTTNSATNNTVIFGVESLRLLY